MEIKKISVNNIVVGDEMMRVFREKEQDKVQTPLMMILGGKDQVVCNRKAK